MHLRLRELQHVNLLVDDYYGALETLCNVLGAHVNYVVPSQYQPPGGHACLVTIGPIVFELIGAPPGKNEGLRRLLDDVGPGYIGAEFSVDDLDVARRQAADRGLRTKYDKGSFFVTDPRDSFGLALECFNREWYVDPPDKAMTPVEAHSYWEYEHALTIVGLECLTVAVRDRTIAEDRWLDVVGDDGGKPGSLRAANVNLVLVDGADDEVAGFLSSSGERIYSITFAVRDIERTFKSLKLKCPECLRIDETRVLLPAEANCGFRMEFVEA